MRRCCLIAGIAFFLLHPVARGQTAVDRFGDPLPAGAIARIGTMRYRVFDRDSARLAPDGKSLAVARDFSEIDVWRLPEWTDRRVLRLPAAANSKPPQFVSLRFSPSGKILAAFDSANQRIAFFDLASAKLLSTLALPEKVELRDLDLVIAPDERTIAAVGWTPRVWPIFLGDRLDGTFEHKFDAPTRGRAFLSGDGRLCAIRSDFTSDIEVRDLRTGQSLWKAASLSYFMSAAFSPDRKRLIIIEPTSIRSFDAATGVEHFHQRCKSAHGILGFAPDGKSLLLSDDKRIAVWDAASGKPHSSAACPTDEYVRHVVFTPGGQTLALAQSQYISNRNSVHVWDASTGKSISPAGVPEEWIHELRFSRNGELHATSGWRSAWWNPRTGKKLRDAPARSDSILDAQFSWEKERALFAGGTQAVSVRNHDVRIWATRTGRDTEHFALPLVGEDTVRRYTVSPNGRHLAFSVFDCDQIIDLTEKPPKEPERGKLMLWDREKKTVVRVLMNPSPDHTAVFSGNGRWLAFIDREDRVQVGRFDEPTKDFRVLDGVREKVRAIVLSPDGREIACGVEIGDERRIRLCDTTSGKVRRELGADPTSRFGELSYSPDGTMLAGASHYATALVWETGFKSEPVEFVEWAEPPDAAIEPPKGVAKSRNVDDPLPAGAVSRIGTTWYRIPESVDRKTVRLSPKADCVAGLTRKGAIATWRLPDWTPGSELRPADARPGKYASYSFASGDILAGFDKEARRIDLFEAATGKRIAEIELPADIAPWMRSTIVSPDRRTLVSTGEAGDRTHRTVVWNLADRTIRHVIQLPVSTSPSQLIAEPEEAASCPGTLGGFLVGPSSLHAVSADARWLAVMNLKGDDERGYRMEIWDCATGKSVCSSEQGRSVSRMAFSADGKRLAAIDAFEPNLRVLDVPSGKDHRSLRAPDRWIGPLVFAPDGRSFWAVARDFHASGLRQWRLDPGEFAAAIPSPIEHAAQQLAFPSGGKLTALAIVDNVVHCWEVEERRLLSPSTVSAHAVSAVHFSANGELFIGFENGEATWRNPRTGTSIRDLRIDAVEKNWKHDRIVMLASGDRLVGYCACRNTTDVRDEAVWIADARTGKHLFSDESQEQETTCLFDEGRRAASLIDKTVRVWSTTDGRDLFRFDIPHWNEHEKPNCLSVSEDGRFLAASTRQRLVLWDNEKRVVRAAWPIESPWPFDLVKHATIRFSRGGDRFVFPESKTRLRLVEIGASLSEQVLTAGEGEVFGCVELSPDGRQLACALHRTVPGEPGRIVVFETATRKPRLEMPGHGSAAVRCLAYSPDAALLASGSSDTTALVWHVGLRSLSNTPEPTDVELDAALSKLADDDARDAFAAMRRLAQAPERSLKRLAVRYPPAARPDLKGRTLADWIHDLGDDSFQVRNKAAAFLHSLRSYAAKELQAVRADSNDEAMNRNIEELLRRLESRSLTSHEIACLRALDLAESLGSPAARDLVSRWAQGESSAVLTEQARRALDRMR